MVIFDKKCKITHSYYRIKGFKEVAIQKKKFLVGLSLVKKQAIILSFFYLFTYQSMKRFYLKSTYSFILIYHR